MERDIRSRFNEFILSNMDWNSLYNEGIFANESDDIENKKKKLKVDECISDYNSLNFDVMLKEISLESSIIVTEKFIMEHVMAVIKLYDQGSSYTREMDQFIQFTKKIILSEKITSSQLTKMFLKSPEMCRLPLAFIWRLAQVELFTVEQFLNKFKKTSHERRLLNDAVCLIFEPSKDEFANAILCGYINSLIQISYEIAGLEFKSFQGMNKHLLTELLNMILLRIGNNMPQDNEAKSDCINIYDHLTSEISLSKTSIHQFLASQLIIILTYSSDICLSEALQQQTKWRSTNCSKLLSRMLLSIIRTIGIEDCFRILDDVVRSQEVNWGSVLSCISCLLVSHQESAAKLKGVVENYIREGCQNNSKDVLILGFLYARHAALEGRHIFPFYSQWFASTFGTESSSPANNKQAFVYLIKFLTELVPYESCQNLKAHICQSIFVPKMCQNIYRDYLRLARVRLKELNEDDSLPTSSSARITSGAFSEDKENKVKLEIESVIKQFEESGKLPSFVVEWSIFNRPYLLKTFLPSLLTPRRLPDVPDARMNLISELMSLNKIPEKMYHEYEEKCREYSENLFGMEPDIEVVDPPDALSIFMKSLVEFTEADKGVRDNKSEMIQLSRLTLSLENHFARLDKNVSYSSSLEIDPKRVDFDSSECKVVSEVVNLIRKLGGMKESNPNARRKVNQLVSLLASTPSTQSVFIATIIKTLKEVARENKRKQQDQSKVLGVILCELFLLEGRFLPMKLATSPGQNFVDAGSLILEQVSTNEPRSMIFACYVFESALEWKKNHSYLDENSGEELKFKAVYCSYFCLAVRLGATNSTTDLEGTDNEEKYFYCDSALPTVAGSKFPKCCQFLVQEFNLIYSHTTLEEWVKFELETPWEQTRLDIRIEHLYNWLLHFWTSPSGNEDSVQEDRLGKGFVELFMILLEVGVRKVNSAEFVIVMQRIGLERPRFVSLLEEWKKWKENEVDETKTTSFYHESSYSTDDFRFKKYLKKLAVFLNLCKSLPPSTFVGKIPFYGSSRLFTPLIKDVLRMNGSLYLSLRDTRFFLESYLEGCQSPNVIHAHVQQSFTLLRESVLFHQEYLSPIWKKYQSVVDSFSCLANVVKPEAGKNLSSQDSAIILSSYLIKDSSERMKSEINTLMKRNCSEYLPRVCALLGHLMIRFGGSLNLSEVNVEARDNWAFISGSASKTARRVGEAAARILRTFDVHSSEPLKVMSTWKESISCSPNFCKSFAIGVSYLLVCNCGNESELERILWLFSLLLVCFNSLAKMFEDSSSEELPLDYVCFVNSQLHLIARKIPSRSLALISRDILSKCDKELIALILSLSRSK